MLLLVLQPVEEPPVKLELTTRFWAFATKLAANIRMLQTKRGRQKKKVGVGLLLFITHAWRTKAGLPQNKKL
jgi:hypothetical protein